MLQTRGELSETDKAIYDKMRKVGETQRPLPLSRLLLRDPVGS